ncbi:MAG: NAD(+) diphosphatase [Acidimicrobiia bacterium]
MPFIPMLTPPDGVRRHRWFLVRGTDVLLVDHSAVADNDAAHFLGVHDEDIGWWAIDVDTHDDYREETAFVNLRALYDRMNEEEWVIAGRAVQLVEWARNHRYCGRCGTRTVPSPGERALRCPNCRLLAYPRLSPAIIVVVDKGDDILLARNVNFPGNMFSALAGFVEPGETLEQAVAREVKEEVGIDVDDVRYIASQPWPFPNSLMLGFRASWCGGEINCDPSEIAEAHFFSPRDLPSIPPRMSIARRLIDIALEERGVVLPR